MMPGLANTPQKENKKQTTSEANLDEDISVADKLLEEEMTQLEPIKEDKQEQSNKLFALKRGKSLESKTKEYCLFFQVWFL